MPKKGKKHRTKHHRKSSSPPGKSLPDDLFPEDEKHDFQGVSADIRQSHEDVSSPSTAENDEHPSSSTIFSGERAPKSNGKAGSDLGKDIDPTSTGHRAMAWVEDAAEEISQDESQDHTLDSHAQGSSSDTTAQHTSDRRTTQQQQQPRQPVCDHPQQRSAEQAQKRQQNATQAQQGQQHPDHLQQRRQQPEQHHRFPSAAALRPYGTLFSEMHIPSYQKRAALGGFSRLRDEIGIHAALQQMAKQYEKGYRKGGGVEGAISAVTEGEVIRAPRPESAEDDEWEDDLSVAEEKSIADAFLALERAMEPHVHAHVEKRRSKGKAAADISHLSRGQQGQQYQESEQQKQDSYANEGEDDEDMATYAAMGIGYPGMGYSGVRDSGIAGTRYGFNYGPGYGPHFLPRSRTNVHSGITGQPQSAQRHEQSKRVPQPVFGVVRGPNGEEELVALMIPVPDTTATDIDNIGIAGVGKSSDTKGVGASGVGKEEVGGLTTDASPSAAPNIGTDMGTTIGLGKDTGLRTGIGVSGIAKVGNTTPQRSAATSGDGISVLLGNGDALCKALNTINLQTQGDGMNMGASTGMGLQITPEVSHFDIHDDSERKRGQRSSDAADIDPILSLLRSQQRQNSGNSSRQRTHYTGDPILDLLISAVPENVSIPGVHIPKSGKNSTEVVVGECPRGDTFLSEGSYSPSSSQPPRIIYTGRDIPVQLWSGTADTRAQTGIRAIPCRRGHVRAGPARPSGTDIGSGTCRSNIDTLGFYPRARGVDIGASRSKIDEGGASIGANGPNISGSGTGRPIGLCLGPSGVVGAGAPFIDRDRHRQGGRDGNRGRAAEKGLEGSYLGLPQVLGRVIDGMRTGTGASTSDVTGGSHGSKSSSRHGSDVCCGLGWGGSGTGGERGVCDMSMRVADVGMGGDVAPGVGKGVGRGTGSTVDRGVDTGMGTGMKVCAMRHTPWIAASGVPAFPTTGICPMRGGVRHDMHGNMYGGTQSPNEPHMMPMRPQIHGYDNDDNGEEQEWTDKAGRQGRMGREMSGNVGNGEIYPLHRDLVTEELQRLRNTRMYNNDVIDHAYNTSISGERDETGHGMRHERRHGMRHGGHHGFHHGRRHGPYGLFPYFDHHHEYPYNRHHDYNPRSDHNRHRYGRNDSHYSGYRYDDHRNVHPYGQCFGTNDTRINNSYGVASGVSDGHIFSSSAPVRRSNWDSGIQRPYYISRETQIPDSCYGGFQNTIFPFYFGDSQRDWEKNNFPLSISGAPFDIYIPPTPTRMHATSTRIPANNSMGTSSTSSRQSMHDHGSPSGVPRRVSFSGVDSVSTAPAGDGNDENNVSTDAAGVQDTSAVDLSTLLSLVSMLPERSRRRTSATAPNRPHDLRQAEPPNDAGAGVGNRGGYGAINEGMRSGERVESRKENGKEILSRRKATVGDTGNAGSMVRNPAFRDESVVDIMPVWTGLMGGMPQDGDSMARGRERHAQGDAPTLFY